MCVFVVLNCVAVIFQVNDISGLESNKYVVSGFQSK